MATFIPLLRHKWCSYNVGLGPPTKGMHLWLTHLSKLAGAFATMPPQPRTVLTLAQQIEDFQAYASNLIYGLKQHEQQQHQRLLSLMAQQSASRNPTVPLDTHTISPQDTNAEEITQIHALLAAASNPTVADVNAQRIALFNLWIRIGVIHPPTTHDAPIQESSSTGSQAPTPDSVLVKEKSPSDGRGVLDN